ncbi:super killer protein 3, partial [Candidatus Hakubella thermalkaliphila]
MKRSGLLFISIGVIVILSSITLFFITRSPGGTSTDHFQKGEAPFAQQKWDEAIEEYTKAIALDRRFISAYRRRAEAYRNKGDIDAAIFNYKKIIELDPENIDNCFQLASLYSSRGDNYSAIAALIKAMEIDPNYMDPMTQFVPIRVFIKN